MILRMGTLAMAICSLTSWMILTMSEKCQHKPSLCLECVALSINSQIRDATTDNLSCPECKEQVEYPVVQRFSSKELFSRLRIDRLMSQVNNFVWCPFGCGTGQTHYPGQSLVYCLRDKRSFCSRHLVPWHGDYTCDEYDAMLADPEHFRGNAQREREAQEELEFTRKRKLRLAAERLRHKEAQRKEGEALEHQARLRNEEISAEKEIRRITKRCPSCQAPIQKNGGCDHMSCRHCGSSFSWLNAR
ncbi:hypothetical protein F4804DRAFT_345805 [Jackrogersella minutella]|nr:hypothetical protein F4804DRAFT_345805 [Jackrogersella minutella]